MSYGRLIALIMLLAACTGPSATPTPSGTRPADTFAPTTPGRLPAPTVTPAPATPAPTAQAPSTAPATVTPSPSPTPRPSPPDAVGLEPFADGLGPLVLLTHAGDGSGQVYAVEQSGAIHVASGDGDFLAKPFLDLADRVDFGGERGLLGLAFHPTYAQNGRLFVNYSDRQGDTVVAEFSRIEGCACADPQSERVLLTIDQPFGNHNGGMLAFGHDGHLYISTGDGGGANDPLGAGQDLTTHLGKMLRIDVDADTAERPYAIPADNPFADGAAGALPEIWDFGLRNPWRVSFDRATGALFIADVGQGSWEEINAEPAGTGGFNYGWNVMEGPACFEPPQGCDQSGLTLPISWYGRADGNCAVTGGYVYRGAAFPALDGTYLFSDYCSGTVWGIDAALAVDGHAQPPRALARSERQVTAFGEDEAGEVYLLTADGEIWRIVEP